MRQLLLSLSIAACSLTAKAQTMATFESLSLSKADTSYINFTTPGKDVGFSDGLAYFPCVYDTSGGYEFWSYGFSYSNRTDSVTSGYHNEYSAKTAKGFAGSDKYAVAYGIYNRVGLTGAASGKSVNGFYITNTTYAYNSMRDGDGVGKNFSGKDKDWFRLDIWAYKGGVMGTDSVSFYLADFRNADTTKNYIVRDWQWVNLLPLGKADSLEFRLSSSDVGIYGMNTPAYFCMDNFITNESGLSVPETDLTTAVKVYPNPAVNTLFVEDKSQTVQQVSITDYSGRIIAQYPMSGNRLEINTGTLAPGTYMLLLSNGSRNKATRFVKQ